MDENKLTEPALRIADGLLAIEGDIDTLVARFGAMQATIATVRKDADLPFFEAQQLLHDCSEAQLLLIRGRHHVARLHEKLCETATGRRLWDVLNEGAFYETPKDQPAPNGKLSIVGSPEREAA